MRYRIRAEYRVSFDEPVREHHLQLRLAPADDASQRVLSRRLEAEGVSEPTRHRDGYGNPVHCLALMAPHQALSVEMHAEIETLLDNPFDYQPVSPDRELQWISESLRQAPRLWDFVLHRCPATADLAALGLGLPLPQPRPGKALIEQVHSVMDWVGRVCDFDPACTNVQPQLRTLLDKRCGSSADLAHLLISVLRGWGIPARFATGYVDPDFFTPDEDDEDTRPLEQQMRAWTDVLIPGAGWRGFDPAKGLVVNQSYVRVAVGRHAEDVVADRATFKGGDPSASRRSLRIEVVASS